VIVTNKRKTVMTIDQNGANAEMEIAFNEAFETDPEFAAAATAMMDEYPEPHADADPEDECDAPMTPSERQTFMMLFLSREIEPDALSALERGHRPVPQDQREERSI
jgi:hypothetical protein